MSGPYGTGAPGPGMMRAIKYAFCTVNANQFIYHNCEYNTVTFSAFTSDVVPMLSRAATATSHHMRSKWFQRKKAAELIILNMSQYLTQSSCIFLYHA